MRLCVVLRSYGGDNDKNRPDFYSKDLALASFLRAAQAATDHGVNVRVVFANDGPIPAPRLATMRAAGEVRETTDGPVGLLDSYRFALDLPDALGLADDDAIACTKPPLKLTMRARPAGVPEAASDVQWNAFGVAGK